MLTRTRNAPKKKKRKGGNLKGFANDIVYLWIGDCPCGCKGEDSRHIPQRRLPIREIVPTIGVAKWLHSDDKIQFNAMGYTRVTHTKETVVVARIMNPRKPKLNTRQWVLIDPETIELLETT